MEKDRKLPNGFGSGDASLDYTFRQENPIKGAILIISLPEVTQSHRPVEAQELSCGDATEINTRTEEVTASY